MQIADPKLRLQRNVLAALFLLMIVSNIFLSLALQSKSTMTVLVPTIDRELKVGTDFVSEEYLKLRSEQLIYLLFSMKPANSDYIKQELLKQVDNSSLQNFKKQIELLASDITSRGYYYWFTDINKYQIDSKNLGVRVGGYLETYLGDKRIGRDYKEYQLFFINRSGLVNLESFMEVKDEESN